MRQSPPASVSPQVARALAFERRFQRGFAVGDDLLLARRERVVQRFVERGEARWQIRARSKSRRAPNSSAGCAASSPASYRSEGPVRSGRSPSRSRTCAIGVRGRSSIWIEQGTPKAKVVSSILTGRTTPLCLFALHAFDDRVAVAIDHDVETRAGGNTPGNPRRDAGRRPPVGSTPTAFSSPQDGHA